MDNHSPCAAARQIALPSLEQVSAAPRQAKAFALHGYAIHLWRIEARSGKLEMPAFLARHNCSPKSGAIRKSDTERNMPANSFKFFANRQCCYFPCHLHGDPGNFNCLFCYCPLYPLSECGGEYAISAAGLKDCSACLYPHLPANFENLILKLGKCLNPSAFRDKS